MSAAQEARQEMNKRVAAMLSTVLALSTCVLGAEERPNILLIQADDLGYCDLSIHGNPVIKTPNLDKLGEASLRFTHFYVHSVCAPTRASLMTGRHFLRTGVSAVHAGKDFMKLDEVTIAEVLKEAGYRTGMWGKWHSGKTDGYYPWDRGFDEAGNLFKTFITALMSVMIIVEFKEIDIQHDQRQGSGVTHGSFPLLL